MDVFEALADPVRRALLSQLADGPCRVVDLARAHPVSRPAISRHLRVLGEAGLVVAETQGRERHYELQVAPLEEIDVLLATLRPASGPRITDHHLDALETEVRRTARDWRRTTTDQAHPTSRISERTA